MSAYQTELQRLRDRIDSITADNATEVTEEVIGFIILSTIIKSVLHTTERGHESRQTDHIDGSQQCDRVTGVTPQD